MRMKFYGLGAVALLLCACQGAVGTVETSVTETVDTTQQWEITLKRPQFSSESGDVAEALMPLNERVDSLLIALTDSLKKQSAAFYAEFSREEEFPMFQLYVSDSVFMATSERVSLLLPVYTYTGGAHGMTTFYAFNYDPGKKRFLTDEDMLDYERMGDINKLLKDNFSNPDSCFWEEPSLELATCINETPEAVVFTYEQYVLGPYACGPVQVAVPKAQLEGILRK